MGARRLWWRALRAASALALALLVVGAAPAAGGCGGTEHFRRQRALTPGRAPLAIGDSVMLGAVREVPRQGFELDVRGCRQMGEGLRVLRARRRAGTLPRFVVIALGTNWTIGMSEVRQALVILGRRRLLGLVTPREEGGGSGSDAAVVRAAGRRYRHRILVLDWVACSARHAGWFAPDGVHLGPGGAAGLGRLLRRGLELAYPPVAVWRHARTPPVTEGVASR